MTGSGVLSGYWTVMDFLAGVKWTKVTPIPLAMVNIACHILMK